MCTRVNRSAFPAADALTNPLQPHHKTSDVTRSPDIKRNAALSKADAVQAPLEETLMMDRLLHRCQIRNQLLRECLAELLGIYVLMVSIDVGRMFKT